MDGRTTDPVMAACSRYLAMYVALQQWQVSVTHVPGVSLDLADALSRYDLGDNFKKHADKRVKELGLTRVKPIRLFHLLKTDY